MIEGGPPLHVGDVWSPGALLTGVRVDVQGFRPVVVVSRCREPTASAAEHTFHHVACTRQVAGSHRTHHPPGQECTAYFYAGRYRRGARSSVQVQRHDLGEPMTPLTLEVFDSNSDDVTKDDDVHPNLRERHLRMKPEALLAERP